MGPTRHLARAALRLAAACQRSSASSISPTASNAQQTTRHSINQGLPLCTAPVRLPHATTTLPALSITNTKVISNRGYLPAPAAGFSTSRGPRQDQQPPEDFSQCTTPDQVLAIVEGRGEALGDDDLTPALSALARCARQAGGGGQEGVVGHAAFQALADMAAQGAARQPAGALASQVASFGALGFRDELVLDALSQQLMVPGRLQELGLGELRQLVEGLAAADHSPSILLLDAVSERLHHLTNSSSPSGSGTAGDTGDAVGATRGGRDARDQTSGSNANSSGGGQGSLEVHVGAIQARLRDLGHSGDVGDQGLGLGGQQAAKEQPDRAGPDGRDYA